MKRRVTEGIFQINGFRSLPDQPHDTLCHGETDLADRLLIQPLGCPQHIALLHWIQQKDGAHLRAHGALNAAHDQIQHRLQIRGRTDFLYNLAQCTQHAHGALLSLRQAPASSRARRGDNSFIASRYTSRLKDTTCPRGYQ